MGASIPTSPRVAPLTAILAPLGDRHHLCSSWLPSGPGRHAPLGFVLHGLATKLRTSGAQTPRTSIPSRDGVNLGLAATTWYTSVAKKPPTNHLLHTSRLVRYFQEHLFTVSAQRHDCVANWHEDVFPTHACGSPKCLGSRPSLRSTWE